MVLPLVIASSDLLVIMPSRLAEQFARLVRLKLMELPAKVPPYDIKLYWHERFRDDPANRWLRGLFISLFAERQRGPMPASAR
jgi:DNA-binding transcriptional LysR family regulator